MTRKRETGNSSEVWPADGEVLAGLVERVTFHNEENGFCVLRVKARGHRDLATVVGYTAAISAGEWIAATGEWTNDRTHGVQFRARFLRTSAPTSVEGIEKYLASGMIRGVGPVYARKLVQAFGDQVFDLIENAPDRLREVDGIGPVRAAWIVNAWGAQKMVREIMVFLHAHGVGSSRAVRIYKTYGSDAVQIMSENPYRLARDIRGIGFKTADALLEVPRSLVETALQLEVAEGTVVADTVAATECVFLGGLHRAERAIAERLTTLQSGRPAWPAIDPDKAIPWIEGKTGIELADGQKRAVRLALGSKVLVVTGGPGVGKTTIIHSILRILAAKGARVLLCAPTGRAAKRLSEATGWEAKTVHRLLEIDPKTGEFRRGQDHPLDGDLVVVDETSMVDVGLMHALLKAVPERAAVLFVGDVDQLPSVGPGQVLADPIGSAAVPVARLTAVFRQAAQSRIVTTAHRINQGHVPDLRRPAGESDFYFVEVDDPETAVTRLLDLVRDRIPRRFGLHAIRDIQVLCPMNRGSLGARSLNLELQAALNPPGDRRIEKFGWTFAPGDKVMQVENDYENAVYNGDSGFVEDVDPEAGEVSVSFDGRRVVYGLGDLDSLVLAYATTIHKSQGSEYRAGVIPVTTQHYTMLQRNLIYTGITRGKRLVVLVGQKKAVAIAVKGKGDERRWSKLRERLLP